MRRFILSALLAVFAVLQGWSQDKELSAKASELLKNAVMFVDAGMFESAQTEFDYLLKEYPDNYVVVYEYCYMLYAQKRYDEILKLEKKLLGLKGVEPKAYQLIGNIYDMTGRSDKARKVYNEGLKRFPGSGALYLELGNVEWEKKDYTKAFPFYLQGMKAEPSFASNYFRAALLGLSTDELRVWGLVYAETEILLAPNNESRHADMANGIREVLLNNIKITLAPDSSSAKVTLVPSRVITLDPSDNKAGISFPSVYEGCTMSAIAGFLYNKEEFRATIPQLIELRKGIVETYFTVTKNLFGNSMYLLPYQKSVIDAGHWEAYNYFLFSPVAEDEFDKWYESNSEKFQAFVEWFNSDPFHLDDEHTVGQLTIDRDARSIDLVEAMAISAGLRIENHEKPDSDLESEPESE